jgi:enterochelin esterase family protein
VSAVQRAGGLGPWLARFEAAVQKRHDDIGVLNILGMAANYSPNPDAPPFGIDLPVDLATGAFRADVWERWLAFDPLVMLDAHAGALRTLKLLYLDCGTRDEFHLHLGARMFAARLATLGIAHEHEEFDDGHMNIGYRYDVSLPKLARALGAPARA